MTRYEVILADARDAMAGMESGSVDSVVTDPPYAEVDRPYGRWTEEEWFALMKPVVREVRRVLKPHGSAVFIVQPNFERLGKMRLWVWKFLIWAAEEWNLVQDAYWWNYTTMPGAGVQREVGLLRSSVKTCIWLGPPDCYRNQDGVTWLESDSNRAQRLAYRAGDDHSGLQPSGHSRDRGKMAGAAAARVDPSGREKNWESITRQRDYSRPSGRDFDEGVMRGACAERNGNGRAAGRVDDPSGWSKDDEKIANTFGDRGAVTPFNLLPFANSDSTDSAGAHGHGAGTPLPLCRWWVRYLTKPGGTCCDPFAGTATVGVAALAEGYSFVGIERDADYCQITRRRLARVAAQPLLDGLEV